jgi:hypothetical protein
MHSSKFMWASITFGVVTLGGLFSLYQVLFDVWMTAYPYANTSEWRARLYLRLATTVVIGISWCALAVWLFRHRRVG